MPRKPKLALCTALIVLSVACTTRRVSSTQGATGNSPDVSLAVESFSEDDDHDVHLEDDVLPIVPRRAQPRPQDFVPPAIADSDNFPSHPTAPSKSHPPCFPDEVLLVSTMDGQISALDLEHLEKPIWTVGTGSSATSMPEPLLSTSISKIEAGATWVIPSLDGMLHRFYTSTTEEGESLKSTATSSEEILERSIRLDDENLPSATRSDLTVFGSKEVSVMGINARNGHVCYFCDGGPAENGCSADKAAVDDCGLTDEDDVIVVRRVSHAIKALRTRTGEQRWNYSVAQNHLRLEEGPGIRMESHFPPPTSKRSPKNDVIITTCDQPASVGVDDLRFDVLEGRVVISGAAAAAEKRLYDFKVPIANAWLVSAGKLIPINLFDAKNNIGAGTRSSGPSNFLTYLGSFNNQYYLQHSSQVRDLVSLGTRRQASRELEWVTGSGALSCDEKKKPLALTYLEKMTPPAGMTRPDAETTEVAIRSPVFAPGTYLRPANEYQLEVEFSKISGGSRGWRQILKIRNFIIASPYLSMGLSLLASTLLVLIVTFIVQCKHWREVALKVEQSPSLVKFPSVTDSGFEASTANWKKRGDSRSVNECRSLPILSDYNSGRLAATPPTSSSPPPPPPRLVEPPTASKPIYLASPSTIEFDSRFYQDFEPLKCLGKGGFGVVFEAKNRLDDCAYAIKRITLKNKPESKERVRREVMALAKLDHIGIVRYYNSWFESPPIGWDDPFLSYLTAVSTDMYSPTSSDLAQVVCTNPGGGGEAARRTKEEEVPSNAEDGSGDAPSKQQQRRKRLRYESQVTKDLIFNNIHPEDDLDEGDDVSVSVGNWVGGDDDDDVVGRFPPRVPTVDSMEVVFLRDDSDNCVIRNAGGEVGGTAERKGSKFFHRCDSVIIPSSPSSPTLKRIGTETLSPSDSGFDLLPLSGREDRFDAMDGSFDVVFEHSTQNVSTSRRGSLEAGKLNLFLKSEDSDEENESFGGPKSFFPISEDDDGVEEEEREEKERAPVPRPPTVGEIKPAPSNKIFLYIQMQLCLKETLKDWLRVNLDRCHATVLDTFAQIVDAVQFLHNQGLIHRDLKPSNIFFSANDGTVKIGDFGLVTAMVLDEPATNDANALAVPSHANSATANQHTDQVGTKLYMSPEQSSGLSYCEKVDIYALGIIFFELLHPFNTEMERGHILTALRQDNAIPDALRKKKKKESGLLLQMIHQDPAKRPSAEEVKLAVEDLEKQNGEEVDETFRGRRRLRSSYSRTSSQSQKSGGSGRSTTRLDSEDDFSFIQFSEN